MLLLYVQKVECTVYILHCISDVVVRTSKPLKVPIRPYGGTPQINISRQDSGKHDEMLAQNMLTRETRQAF